MEDAHINQLNINLTKTHHVFGVFDSSAVSCFIKDHFVEELMKNINYKRNNIQQALIDTFLIMDKLLDTEQGQKELQSYATTSKHDINVNAMNVGSTACVCLIDEDNRRMYFANAGDSRVVLCKEGKAFQMSYDHKPNLFLEKNRIYKAKGYIVDGRINKNLNLSRTIGDLQYKQGKDKLPQEQIITAYPDIVIENYDEECDFILIGCDGIWDCISNQELCDEVIAHLHSEQSENDNNNNNIKLSQIAGEIMDKLIAVDSKQEKGCDNMTLIIIKFKH